jgi:hypothetical protein
MSAIVPYGNGTAYLIPTFVGMTSEFDLRSIPAARWRAHPVGSPDWPQRGAIRGQPLPGFRRFAPASGLRWLINGGLSLLYAVALNTAAMVGTRHCEPLGKRWRTSSFNAERIATRFSGGCEASSIAARTVPRAKISKKASGVLTLQPDSTMRILMSENPASDSSLSAILRSAN